MYSGEELRYAEKVVVLTGGTSGIGKGCVRVFVENGAKVVFCAKQEEQRTGEELEDELNTKGPGKAIFIPCDVTQEEDIKNLINKTVEKYGTIDCLINNAGCRVSLTVRVPSRAGLSLTVRVSSRAGLSLTVRVPSRAGLSLTVRVPSRAGLSLTVRVPPRAGLSLTVRVSSRAGLRFTIRVPSRAGLSLTVRVPSRAGLSLTVRVPSHAGLTLTVRVPSRAGLSLTVRLTTTVLLFVSDPPPRTIDEFSAGEFRELFELHVIGHFLTSKYALPHLRKSKGNIIFNASLVARMGQRHAVTYVATKGALVAMTRALAIDEAVHGVRVNSFSPGNIWTPLWSKAANETGDPQGAIEMGKQAQLMGRMGTPKEAGRLCLFLASEASFLTGVDIPLSGGAELDYGSKARISPPTTPEM
ncbi:17-beta-hydroxysteroid dehydrogenase 14 [Lamellibrachia satsuma]|nr:17-beta-hydroxysteroid dehydrogenase 14 [Lamellibrachia satsuma]